MLARVIVIATCLSVRASVCLSVRHTPVLLSQHTPATALDRLADMISGRAVEEAVTTNLFAWVRWIVTKEVNFSVDYRVDWKI